MFWPLVRRTPKPLTVILGAGATLHAGAPSTNELTALVNQWSQQASEDGEVSRRIIATLGSYFRNVNFELIINALEELEPIAVAYARPNVPDESRPVVASFLLPGSPQVVYSPEVLRKIRHRLLYEIASHCHARTHASDVGQLRALLGALATDFSVRVFTLNYDDLIDRAGDFADGFTAWHIPTGRIPWANPVLRFDAREFALARRSGKALLVHMHGSVRFGYQIECDGVVKYDRAIDALASLFTAQTNSNTDRGNILTAGPIISGFNKVAKLAGNPEPYAHYYAAFTEALLSTNRVLVIGYGGMDQYVNTWLQEFAKTHGSRRRIAWVTHIPGSDVGSGRPDIKLLKDLSGREGLTDSNAYDGGDSFQIQGTIALECSGFPEGNSRLSSIIRHLASA